MLRKKVTLVILLTIFSMFLVPSSYCESDSSGTIEYAIIDQYRQTTDPTYQVYRYPTDDPKTDIMYPFVTTSYYRILIYWSPDVSSTEIVVRDKLRADLGIKRTDFKLFVNWYSYEEHPGVKLYFNETSGDLEVRVYPQIIGVLNYPGWNKGIVHILLQCNITRKLSEIFSIAPLMPIVPNFIIKGRMQHVFCMITPFKLKTENNLLYIRKVIYLHSDNMSKPITAIPHQTRYVIMPPSPEMSEIFYSLYRHQLRWVYTTNPLEGEYTLSEYYKPVMAIWNVNATKEAYIVNGINAMYIGNGGDIPTIIRDKNAKGQILFDGKDELKLAGQYPYPHQLNMPIGYVLSEFSVYVLQKIKI